MKTSVECLDCEANTYTNIVDKYIKDQANAYEAMCRIAKVIGDNYDKKDSASIGTIINKIIMEYVDDPFYQQKQDSTKIALQVYEELKDIEINLEVAAKIALYGNIMDYGVKDLDPTKISTDLKSIFSMEININHLSYLESELNKAKTVLYLTDNAGEVVLDYFLVKYIKDKGIDVVLSPKVAPIQNDATIEDIKHTPVFGIVNKIVPVAQALGLDLENSSDEFKKIFDTADVIILKGMGYFENAYKYDKNSFFILKAKCNPVAREIGVKKQDNVVIWRRTK